MVDYSKKLAPLIDALLISGAMLVTLMIGLHTRCSRPVGKYVVTKKYNNTIFYIPVDSTDFHAMAYTGYEAAQDKFMYKYINVGDTIYGLRAEMDNPISIPTIKSKRAVIKSINGRTYDELKRIEARDSAYAYHSELLNEIRQHRK